MYISINLSPRQFADPGLVEKLERVLAEIDLPPECLRLEITENVIVENPDSAQALFARVRALGIKLCLDDFGTGFSSLSYLQSFPLDVLKIDRAFVGRIDTDETQAAIVSTIVSLAHTLGMEVVAEGVETLEQAQRLQDLGCDYGQGYLCSRPVAGEAAERLIGRLL